MVVNTIEIVIKLIASGLDIFLATIFFRIVQQFRFHKKNKDLDNLYSRTQIEGVIDDEVYLKKRAKKRMIISVLSISFCILNILENLLSIADPAVEINLSLNGGDLN